MVMFLSNLLYDDLPDSGFWITKSVFLFSFKGRIFRIPPGFVLDFYSVPWFARWVFPRKRKVPKQNKPALVHDFLRRFYRVFGLSVAQTDVAFQEAMQAAGLPGMVRGAKFASVRIHALALCAGRGKGRPPFFVRRAMSRYGLSWQAYAQSVRAMNGLCDDKGVGYGDDV